MKNHIAAICSLGALSLSQITWAATVNCDGGDKLAVAVAAAAPGDTIDVTGTCNEVVVIRTDRLKIKGNGNTVIQKNPFIPSPIPVVIVDGAVGVELHNLALKNGLFGLSGSANANVLLSDVSIVDNILGISLSSANATLQRVTISASSPGKMAMGISMDDGAGLVIKESAEVSGAAAFGFSVLSNSTVRVAEKAMLSSHHNLVGGQISVKSSLFAETGSKINVSNNTTIGLSTNTGATTMLFNAALTTTNNGLDGFDVVSAANFEVDGTSEIVSDHNGRQGVSIDNGVLNMFGFFSGGTGLPRLTSTNNGQNGIQLQSTSKLDIGQNAFIVATGNQLAGVTLDDGSSANIQSSDINDNFVDDGGTLAAKRSTAVRALEASNIVIGDGTRPALQKDVNSSTGKPTKLAASDVMVTFGSRVTFLQNNNIGRVSCDNTSLARGDVRCNQPN